MGLKWRFLFETFVIMRRVRGQHHRAPGGINADGLQTTGMARQVMHSDARRDFFVARMEDNPVAIGQTHHF